MIFTKLAMLSKTAVIKAPFPWFGGKSRVSHIVWPRFGDVPNYSEPFAGSCAMLFGRPYEPRLETINDYDGYVANFWRAIKYAPAEVAGYADWPVNENDLHARHVWLVQYRDELRERLEGNPEYYDAKIAGWWVWGMSVWIGGGFCSGDGPWGNVDGRLVRSGDGSNGVKRQRVHLGGSGSGTGTGVHKKSIAGGGIYDWFGAISERLCRVRVTCGDWKRVCGKAPTYGHGLITGVFLDPPYGVEANRENNIYSFDSTTVAGRVREWCLENGDNPLLRIALCGYAGEGHEVLEDHGWSVIAWKAAGGYGVQSKNGRNDNHTKERIWFSPHCLDPDENRVRQLTMPLGVV